MWQLSISLNIRRANIQSNTQIQIACAKGKWSKIQVQATNSQDYYANRQVVHTLTNVRQNNKIESWWQGDQGSPCQLSGR